MFISRHHPPRAPKFETFGDYLHFAYANMQMLIMSINNGKFTFDRTCYMLRSKAYKAYREGRWEIHDLHINNVWKLKSEDSYCWYCLDEVPKDKLTIEHIFPRSKNGADDMDNILLVCKSCNSSKRDLDLLEWFSTVRKEWPLPYIFAYYLKHVYLYATKNDLLGKSSEEIDAMELPFKYQYIPLYFPQEYLDWIKPLYSDEDKADNPDSYIKGND